MIIHDALPQQDHAELLDALHRLRDTQIAAGRHPAEQLRQPVFSPAHDLSKERVVQDLLVTPKVFPKVVDILGSNLFLYHGYIVGDRAAPPEATIPADMNAVPTFGFHQVRARQVNTRARYPNRLSRRRIRACRTTSATRSTTTRTRSRRA